MQKKSNFESYADLTQILKLYYFGSQFPNSFFSTQHKRVYYSLLKDTDLLKDKSLLKDIQ